MTYEDEQIRERLQRIMHHESINQIELAERTGRLQSNISHILTGKRGVPIKFMEDILKAFPDISREWLMFGEGNMYISEEKNEKKHLPSDTKPRLPRNLVSGHLTDYFEGPKRNQCEELPVDTRMPAYDFSLFLKTDRMSPNYRRGDELFFKKTDLREWGNCYLLDTSEGPKFKKVYEDKDEKGNPVYRCVAYDRQQYPDFCIPKELVYGFYKCVGSLRVL